MLVWRKLSSAKWEDAWLERLSFVDPQRIVISAFSGARTIRIEVYDLSKKDAEKLRTRFGGQVREWKKRDFVAENSAPRAPLKIRNRLLVVRSEEEKVKHGFELRNGNVLVIPAEMAFGTGDHATTATCLRLLCDLAATQTAPWEMLDLGTGTGILALAARLLGAARADAFDFDPACVRVTRANAVLNKIKLHAIRRVDVTRWAPVRRWHVVTANLYSEILTRAAPQIVRALAPGGTLIFSGIMRAQEADCVRAFRAEGLRIDTISRRGKWVTGLARKAAR